jgi:succinate dehydrogenase / fumarate reductase iron-sulfur subunit
VAAGSEEILMSENQFTLKVFRFDPDTDTGHRYDSYTVPLRGGMTVLDALFYVLEEKDPSLAFRYACRGAVCGSCAMHINGTNRLACQTQIVTLQATEVQVSPLPYLPLIKDLVVEMAPFYQKMDNVQPYLITHESPPEKEYLQSPRQRKKLDSVTDCIWCAACYSACPVAWGDPEYLGPAALVKAQRFAVDSRDQGGAERLKPTDAEEGLWRCHTVFNCVEVCPKEINQTEAIEGLRRRTLKRRLGWK